MVNNAAELSRTRKTFGDVIESRGRRAADRTVSAETWMEQLLWKLLNVVKLSAIERIKESKQPVLRCTNKSNCTSKLATRSSKPSNFVGKNFSVFEFYYFTSLRSLQRSHKLNILSHV